MEAHRSDRPLNGLQEMMLRWEQFHPLNAAHLFELAEPVSVEAAQSSLNAALATLTLGQVEFSRCKRRLKYYPATSNASATTDGPVVESHVGTDSETAIRTVIDEQLNRPFPESGPHWPYRFIRLMVLDGRCFLGVIYRHAVSDSRGVQLIVRCWMRFLFGLSQPGEPLSTNAPTLEQLFPRDLSWWRAPLRIRELAAELWHSSACFRPAERSGQPLAIASSLHGRRLPVTSILRTAKSHGVTVQDALFAALFEGLGLLFCNQLGKSRRKKLSLYAAADLRRESDEPLDAVLGQLLGAITVRAHAPVGRPFAETIKNVAVQTQAIKRAREHVAHASHLSTMARLWDRVPAWINRVAGPTLLPVMSLTSNVNLTEFLSREIAAGFVVDYHRFTGTGILTPMMAGLTTLGNYVNFSSTRHTNIFSAEEHDVLMRHVERRLTGQLSSIATLDQFYSDTPRSIGTPRHSQRLPDCPSRVG